jgi:large subunit ribosomal protein L24
MIRTRLKKNDEVMVLTGSDKGKRGRVLLVDLTKGRVLVEGINKKTKHVRATKENTKGGIMQMERPVAVSNVLFYCDKCKRGVRLGVEMKDQKKIRVCRKCGKSLD